MILDHVAGEITDIDNEALESELNKSGNDTTVNYVDNNSDNDFLVTFKDTAHQYTVDKNGNATLYGIVVIEDDPVELSPIIKAWTSSSDTDFHQSDIRTSITEIEFVDLRNKIAPTEINNTTSWDVSANEGDKTVIAWLEDAKLYIGGIYGVKANEDSSFIFYNFPNLTNIKFNNSFYTNNVKNMSCMFMNSLKLEKLDLSSFETREVTDMNCMFAGLDINAVEYIMALTEIKGLEKFNTSNVTKMNCMFCNCANLTSLDVSNFDTSNVTSMQSMFNMPNNKSGKIQNIKFGNKWNTSKVTDMGWMFAECSMITSLDLSMFDTSNVTDTRYMFAENYNLKTIYAGDNWNTENITQSNCMFLLCSLLVGGNGTKLTSSLTDETYAKIDRAGQAGYLTQKIDYGINYMPNMLGMTLYTDSEEYTSGSIWNNKIGTNNIQITGTAVKEDDGSVTLNGSSTNCYGSIDVGTTKERTIYVIAKMKNSSTETWLPIFTSGITTNQWYYGLDIFSYQNNIASSSIGGDIGTTTSALEYNAIAIVSNSNNSKYRLYVNGIYVGEQQAYTTYRNNMMYLNAIYRNGLSVGNNPVCFKFLAVSKVNQNENEIIENLQWLMNKYNIN